MSKHLCLHTWIKSASSSKTKRFLNLIWWPVAKLKCPWSSRFCACKLEAHKVLLNTGSIQIMNVYEGIFSSKLHSKALFYTYNTKFALFLLSGQFFQVPPPHLTPSPTQVPLPSDSVPNVDRKVIPKSKSPPHQKFCEKSCNGTNIFMRWKMKCSIQWGEAKFEWYISSFTEWKYLFLYKNEKTIIICFNLYAIQRFKFLNKFKRKSIEKWL